MTTITTIQTRIDNNDNLFDLTTNHTGAEMTCRLIPGDKNFEYPEWSEQAEIDGIPVTIIYRTTPEDQTIINESGDLGDINWGERVESIAIDYDAMGED